MIIIYRPGQDDEQSWDLTQVKVTFAEAKAFEKATGVNWRNAEAGLLEGTVDVIQAVLWILRKRTEPALTLADLDDMAFEDVAARYGPAERTLMRAFIEADQDLSDEERAATLALFDAGSDEDDVQDDGAGEDGAGDPKASTGTPAKP